MSDTRPDHPVEAVHTGADTGPGAGGSTTSRARQAMTDGASEELMAEVQAAERHLARTEVKANLLALLFGGVVLGAGGAIVQLQPPLPSAVGAWGGVGLFGLACGLLARAVRPSLTTRSGTPYGIVLYASLSVEQIPAAVTAAYAAPAMSTRLIDASTAAVTKYRWIGRAVDVAWLGAAVLAATALTVALVRLGWLHS